MPDQTLQVVLFAGPGAGKSTTAALVFGALKQRGYNVEMAHEYAKDLTWERAHGRLEFQPHVAAEQMWRLRRLEGQVDAIITDTSTLLGLVYGTLSGGATPAFREWLLDDFRRQRTINFFLQRDPARGYNQSGRSQDEQGATKLDRRILTMLLDNEIPFMFANMDKDTNAHVDFIVDLVSKALDAS